MHALRSPDHCVIRFTGPDAQSFLQSQLSNDVAALAPGAWQWQGYCTAKGRLLATMALVRSGTTEFLGILHQSLATAVARRLAMYRLRARLEITVDAQLGVFLHLAQPAPTAGTVAMAALGGGRWYSLASAADCAADANAAISAEAAELRRRWALAGIDARQPEITADTSEHFVPQMIGWDQVAPGGGVSFSKGCYPGQEIVARAHYRGAVKRHLERVELPADSHCVAGSTVSLPDGREGEICNVATLTATTCAALVVLANDAD